jgi:hypothetical protein
MALVVAFLLILLALMYIGWRARQRRQAGLAQPEQVPTELGTVYGEFDGFYVATTVAGEPLNRIAVRGLGYRSRARITIATAGIVLAIRGERDAFIPVSAIREVTRATWTIDRVVETGGLVLVGWTLGSAERPSPASTGASALRPQATTTPTPVDTYFRLESATELLAALNLIFTAPTGRKA